MFDILCLACYLNRNEFPDPGEPTTVSGLDGSYAFTNLSPGKYVIRSILPAEREHSYPGTIGGILWPTGTSNPSIGNVNPTSITDSLVQGQSHRQNVSITLPNPGIDRIYVQFSEPVLGFNASNVKLLGSNLSDYASIASVSYDSGNRLGLIQLTSPNTITKDKLRVGVSDAVTDIALPEH